MAQLLILALLVFPLAARGGISARNSSVAYSDDGAMLLIMVSPDAQDDQSPPAALPGGRVVNLRDIFPKSGVYKTSTLEPVWQVDWFSLQGDLLWSVDLRQVVRLNRQGFRSDWAIAFYSDGKLARKYDCGYLLTSMDRGVCLPYSTWDWHTRWYEDFELNAARNNVLLSTARRQMNVAGHEFDLGLQEFYTFDLAGGSLVSRRVVGAWRLWAYGAASVGLVVVLVLAIRRLWRRFKASRRRRRSPVA